MTGVEEAPKSTRARQRKEGVIIKARGSRGDQTNKVNAEAVIGTGLTRGGYTINK